MYKGPGMGANSMFFLGTAKSVRLRTKWSWRLDQGSSSGRAVQSERFSRQGWDHAGHRRDALSCLTVPEALRRRW